jgi:hypothetical protein
MNDSRVAAWQRVFCALVLLTALADCGWSQPAYTDLRHVPQAEWVGGWASVPAVNVRGAADDGSCPVPSGDWCWQLLPDGLIYHSYLAGIKEPRFAINWMNERGLGDLWDVTLGGRVGILRYGNCSLGYPQGWQVDMEGGVMPRLSQDDDLDLQSSDYRFGIPITYGRGNTQYKFAFYHLSSHVGDEFLENNPGFVRINYSRDAFVLGVSHYPWPALRLYGEMGFAFRSDGGSKPWEFQFGVDYAPAHETGVRGAPFAAANAHLREDVDFGGSGVLQAGWAWRGSGTRQLFRAGLQYYNGKSSQFQFFDRSEQQTGFALWYDY